ncbi:MAG: hypothetical protein ACKN85_14405 [Pirellula sp.]
MNAATASEIARLESMTITKVVERFESCRLSSADPKTADGS